MKKVTNNNQKKSVNDKAKTVDTLIRQNKAEYFIVNVFCLLIFISFAFIAIMSMVQTSVIDPENYSNEVIIFQTDNIALNLLFTSLFAVFLFKMKKHYDFFKKLNIKYVEIILFAFVTILGMVWILSVTSSPTSDSKNIFETATEAIKGDYSSLKNGQDFYNSDFYGGISYYNYYPFQLGFVFLSEIVYRIFGTSSTMPIQIINVLCLACAYLGIAKITRLLFNKISIEFFAIVLLAGCIQPILFCTYAYGNIIGMCCAIWASFFLIKYFKTNKYLMLIPCGVLLVVSVIAKYNNLIYLVAFTIMLIIHTIRNKKWQSIAFAVAICIATVGSSNLIIMSYESRANTNLANGVSQLMYLDMGINDSYMAPGWYNGITVENYMKNNCNDTLANQQAWNDITKRLGEMSDNMDSTIDFFSKKILSQWNETTFESIWVSKIRTHEKELNGIGNAVYDGSTGQFLGLYFNLYMQIIYILFAAGIYFLFLKKYTNIETVLLPLVLLGAFGYHLLYEGKSQYILSYIILMIPTVAFSINCILEGKYIKIKQLVSELKTIPEIKKDN